MEFKEHITHQLFNDNGSRMIGYIEPKNGKYYVYMKFNANPSFFIDSFYSIEKAKNTLINQCKYYGLNNER